MVTKLLPEPYVIMGMVWCRCAKILAIFVWIALCAPAWSEAENHEGRRIVDIQFSPPEQPVDPADLAQAVTLKKGTALHLADVRQSIEKLFATGRYEDIQVDAEPQGDGVVVRFITRNSWFVGHVSVDGKVSDPPNRGQMADATGLNLGQPFREEAMGQAETALRNLLTGDGYYESQIQQSVEYDPKTQQAHIRFLVSSGPRARYHTPVITGNLKMAVETIIRATHWKRRFIGGWHLVTQTRTAEGLDKVRARYEKDGRLMSTVDLKSMDYDHDTRRVTPVLDIDAGPKIDIKAIGAKVSAKKLQQNLPIYEEHTVDRDLLVEGQTNLRDEFQAAGYFEADVEFKEQKLQNDRQEIDYLINLGPRHRLVHLEIQGNHYFTTDSIRERMLMTPKSLQFRRGRYSEAGRRRDEQSIMDLYRSNGFRDVQVTSEVLDDYQGKTGDIAVIVRIQEGAQWFVSKLDIVGIEQVDASSIIPTLSSSEGQPFSEFNVAADRDAILAYYFTNGFPNASFEWSSKPGPQPHQVDLRFEITEGKRQFVRDVLVEGLESTRPSLVVRRLLLEPGDALSLIRMSESQRRLYDLGIFATVDMAVQDPDGQTQRKYVIYEMEEAKKYSIETGLGAEIARIGGGLTSLNAPGGTTGLSPRASFDVTRLNVFGLGQTVSLQTRISTLETRGLLTYLAPRVHNRDDLDLSFTALYDLTRLVNTFSAKREEGSVQLSQRLSKPSTILYRFSYRRVSTSDLKIDSNLLPLLSQPVRVGMLSVNYIQDRRDDPVDPRKGIYNTVDLGLASRVFGSQINFIRGLARNATYHRIGKKLVLARQFTFGDIIPYSYQPSPTDPFPFPERFFSGGDNSNRGFPESQAGPRDLDTGFPIGGRAMLFNSTELRFPLLGDNIGGVLFHDAGNVYSSLDKISLRVHQQNRQDFNNMVHAVGYGILYRTPIGPVRVDLAYSINPPHFFGCSGNIDQLVACGQPPAPGQVNPLRTNHSISHFQFFFSIGQAF
ncbi:MAG TPA: BamA/TamA family outer membrane protein [Bryobacteraceae bacterium]|nr:BamA/TamA family outer membrane protein [Bryobacteraceae bacterium]